MNGPAADDAHDADEQRNADRDGDAQAQTKSEAAHRIRGRVDQLTFGGGPGSFVGDGDQRGFGDGCREPEAKPEGQHPDRAALAGKTVGHAFAEREEAHLEALHEQREAQRDQRESHRDRGKVRQRLAQYHELKERDDKNDRRQVADRSQRQAEEREDARHHI